jgi:hypothetical protein
MLLFLLILLAFVLAVAQLIMFDALGKHRIDIRPNQSPFEGRSGIWQRNVIRFANYTPRGKNLLRWFLVLQFGCGATIIGLVLQFYLRV